jgi:hypothetical protein
VEFETEGEEEEDRPRLTMGEDVKLELSDDEDDEPAAKPEGVLKLDL